MSEIWPDKTDAELAALTSEEVDHKVEHLCMVEGIPLYLDEDPKPEPTSTPDCTVYRIEGVSGLMFRHRDHAERVAATIKDTQIVKWAYDHSHWRTIPVIENDEPNLTIVAEPYYSAQAWGLHQTAVAEYERAKRLWEIGRERVKKARDARSAIAEKVWEEVRQARDRVAEHTALGRRFLRYLELANGDRAVAARFLRLADHLPDDWMPDEAWVLPATKDYETAA